MIDFQSLIRTTLPDARFSNATIGSIITLLLPYIFRIAGFLLLGLLVIGGYEIMTSQGDPKKVATGNQRIMYALIGFILIVVSFLIIRAIGRIFDIQQIVDIFG